MQKIFPIIISIFLCAALSVIYISNSNPFYIYASHTSSRIIVNDLRANIPAQGPAQFTWTPATGPNVIDGRLFIGTNTRDPIVGALDSVDINTGDGSVMWAGSLSPGFYHAAMYTGFYGEVLISQITTFTIGSAGGWHIYQPTISRNTVIFGHTSSDGNISIEVTNTSGNNVVFNSGDIPFGSTSTSWLNASAGTYEAKLLNGRTTLDGPISFEVGGGEVGEAECTNFRDCVDTIDAPTKDAPIPFGANTLIVDFISQTLPIIIGLGGFLSVIIILISAVQFVISNGDPEAAAKARGRLIFALVGFALLVLAFAITKVIDAYFLKSGVV